MAGSELKTKTIRGLFWGGFNSGVKQVVSALIGLVLLSKLTPGDYGLVGMLAIFTGIAGTLQEGGFTSALANRKEFSHDDFNSVFWFNNLISILMYVVLWFCAPLIAGFYDQPELVTISRVLFLAFVFNGMSLAYNAYLFRFLMVREKAAIEIISSIVAGLAAIILAIKGYGYWALVVNTVLMSFVASLLRIIIVPWHPTLKLNFHPVWEMFGFSFKLVIASFVTQLQNNIFSVVLGRAYTEREVGFYSQGNKWTVMGQTMISGTVNSVAQPTMAKVVDNAERSLKVFRKFMRLTACMVCPAMLGIAFIAPQLIQVINPEFMPSVPVMQFISIGCIALSLSNMYSQMNIAHGRSDLNLLITVIGAALQIAMAFVVYRYGINVIAISIAACNFVVLAAWQLISGRHVGYTLPMLLMDVLPYAGLAILVVTVTYFATRFVHNAALLLCAKIIVTVVLYVLALKFLDSAIYREARVFIKRHWRR
ncbi:MAG: lipopolysaccharide biosynthesis protein [Bacteroidales bacterium]|nr:lipopolysaccharide biosynthesis protein [Bacteroidales bacterium]